MKRNVLHRTMFSTALVVVALLFCPLEVSSWSLASKPSVTIPSGANDRVDRAQSLLQHLKGGDSYFHPGISVVSVGGGECGIQLQNYFPEAGAAGLKRNHEDVIFVDRSEFLTPHSGLETPVGQALQLYLSQGSHSADAHLEKLPHMYLAIYLVLYKEGLLITEPMRAAADYLATLPSLTAFQNLPVFWEEAMLEELQCSGLKQAVKSRRKEWNQEFLLVQSAMDAVGLSLCSFNKDTWYWARSIITSRAFTDNQNSGHPCLCPYVDMMNHVTGQQSEDNDQVVQCTWEIDSKGYHLRLPENDNDKKIMSDSRLEISYGSHSNAEFLMNYGFSIWNDVEQAEEGIASLAVMLPDSVHERETESLWEADGLGDCHLIARNVTLGIGDAGPMESVLSMCRVASAEQMELSRMKEHFVEQDQHTEDSENGLVPQLGATLCRAPFSVANEIRALQMLQSSTLAALGRYTTTMAEDTDMLSMGRRKSTRSIVSRIRKLWPILRASSKEDIDDVNNPAHWQWLNAVAVRREEKKILQHYFVLASIGLNFLEHAEEDEHFETYKGMLEASLHDRKPFLAI